MEAFGTFPPSPEEGKKMMAANLPKSAVLALLFGVLLAWFYGRLKGGLWVQGGGPLAGMEFATILWLPTIALSTIGGSIWYDKVRRLNNATFWSWLVRVNVAGLLVGLRSEEHTSELQSQSNLVCRLLPDKKKNKET